MTSFAGGVSAAVGPNIFTDIGFEAGVGVYGVDAFKVQQRCTHTCWGWGSGVLQ